MKLYYRVTKPYMSHAFRRIEYGIISTLPSGFEMTENQDEADLCICPITSIADAQDLPYNAIIFQLCHQTAGGSDMEWMQIWVDALLVVSYLNLPIDFYLRMPLGYDPVIFNTENRAATPKYDVVVTGYVDEDGQGEVISRLCKHFRRVMHVGGNLRLKNIHYFNAENISDVQLANIYRTSTFVASMRMVEGFELPIIEGAACGAKPIALDLECYRHWFNDIALFVNPDNLDRDLSTVTRQIWYMGHEELVKRFMWKQIMHEFWHTLINGMLK